MLDNHAPAGNVLMRNKQGKAIVPTFTCANAVVMWTWCAEFFAACTQLGKTPVMYKSYLAPGGYERAARYKSDRGHFDPQSVP